MEPSHDTPEDFDWSQVGKGELLVTVQLHPRLFPLNELTMERLALVFNTIATEFEKGEHRYSKTYEIREGDLVRY